MYRLQKQYTPSVKQMDSLEFGGIDFDHRSPSRKSIMNDTLSAMKDQETYRNDEELDAKEYSKPIAEKSKRRTTSKQILRFWTDQRLTFTFQCQAEQ